MAQPGRNERGEYEDDDEDLKSALGLALVAIDTALEFSIDPGMDAATRKRNALEARALVRRALETLRMTNVGTKPASAGAAQEGGSDDDS